MTSEERQFLIDLQKELNEQDYDCQAAPRFWVVGDYKWVACWEEHAEDYEFYLPDDAESYRIHELIERFKSNYYDLSEEAKHDLNILEENGEIEEHEELLYWIKSYVDSDATLVPIKEEHFIRSNTMFLTKQDAKDHIAANYYHYSDRAHTYAMTAWRSPKVKKLLEILENADF